MVAYKDEERGTWYVSFYYEDWTGAKKRKVKRGFHTKKQALNFEAERRKDCGSATHGTIRRHHSWGLLTPIIKFRGGRRNCIEKYGMCVSMKGR